MNTAKAISLRGIAIAAALSAIGAHRPAVAEGHVEEITAQTQDSASHEERRRLVADHLPLSPAEAARFWPLYEHYQNDLSRVVEQRTEIIAKLGDHYDDMPDAVARQITVDSLELQETRLKLIKSYLPKFAKVLPPRKLARYYQIEARIRAAVDAEIAERIPLIQ